MRFWTLPWKKKEEKEEIPPPPAEAPPAEPPSDIEIVLDCWNIAEHRKRAPQRFGVIRFDSNNDCNVHCVYCHNHRSKNLVDPRDFTDFLERKVLSVDHFQVGCGMEPTLDPRMTDFMLLVGEKARPSQRFRLQTNGTLLHRHDPAKMRAAGLTSLTVSIDAADPELHRKLRGGTSLERVRANLVRFRRDLPEVEMCFITTVTRLNLDAICGLVGFGLDLGAAVFELREMFYYPESGIVDDARMRELVLRPGDFERMRQEVSERYAGRAAIGFYDAECLEAVRQKMQAGR